MRQQNPNADPPASCADSPKAGAADAIDYADAARLHQALTDLIGAAQGEDAEAALAAVRALADLARTELGRAKMAGWPLQRFPPPQACSGRDLEAAAEALAALGPPWALAWIGEALAPQADGSRAAMLKTMAARLVMRGASPANATAGQRAAAERAWAAGRAGREDAGQAVARDLLAASTWAKADGLLAEALSELAGAEALARTRPAPPAARVAAAVGLALQALRSAAERRGMFEQAPKPGRRVRFDSRFHLAYEPIAEGAWARCVTPVISGPGGLVRKGVVRIAPETPRPPKPGPRRPTRAG